MDQERAFMSSLMNYLFNNLDIKIRTVEPYNDQSLQANHRIKSLLTILIKHLTNLGHMWPKYLSLATFVYNTFNTLNLANYRPYELVFRKKPKILLNLDNMPDIKVLGTFKDNHELLNKRLKYNSRDLVYTISPLTSQLCTALRKVMTKYVGPVVIYKIIDPHNYLLMTLNGKIL